MDAVAGFLTPTAMFVMLLVLHVARPAVRVDGYAHGKVTETPPLYRPNGMRVFVSRRGESNSIVTQWHSGGSFRIT